MGRSVKKKARGAIANRPPAPVLTRVVFVYRPVWTELAAWPCLARDWSGVLIENCDHRGPAVPMTKIWEQSQCSCVRVWRCCRHKIASGSSSVTSSCWNIANRGHIWTGNKELSFCIGFIDRCSGTDAYLCTYLIISHAVERRLSGSHSRFGRGGEKKSLCRELNSSRPFI